MIKNIFYDLDGTLLPMDYDVFIKGYFGALVKKLAPYGYDPVKLPEAVWAGTRAMVKNTGEVTNEEAFWDYFGKLTGKGKSDIAIFEEFYEKDFDTVKDVCGYNAKVPELIKKVNAMGLNQVLATNPLFPEVATRKRVSWAGLSVDDFLLYTTYENSHYCKPNVKYYEEILEKLSMKAEETLMIGNDVEEDMVATQIGMKVFLVTDCILNPNDKDIDVYPHGDFDDALAYIEKLMNE